GTSCRAAGRRSTGRGRDSSGPPRSQARSSDRPCSCTSTNRACAGARRTTRSSRAARRAGRRRPRDRATAAARSTLKAALEQREHGVDAVHPPDLLAFVDPPRVIADGHFHDAAARTKQLRRELRLEIEADASETNAVEDVAPERLVCRLHVG